jgi:hypothetical protein
MYTLHRMRQDTEITGHLKRQQELEWDKCHVLAPCVLEASWLTPLAKESAIVHKEPIAVKLIVTCLLRGESYVVT